MSDEVREEFFRTGKWWVNYIVRICRDHLEQNFMPKNALDFGCGTGRVVIPLAEVAKHVTGIDISDAMLQEAQKNCEKYQVTNINLLQSDDQLSALKGHFDFIHSSIVFQHIPIQRGRKIFINLLNHLDDRGIGVIHVTYAKACFRDNYGANPDMVSNRVMPPPIKPKGIIRKILSNNKSKELQDQKAVPESDPEMQMNSYNLNELLFTIQMAGIKKFHTEFTDHGGELGVILFFQKPG
jgi:SAM-dependent methyltransferase